MNPNLIPNLLKTTTLSQTDVKQIQQNFHKFCNNHLSDFLKIIKKRKFYPLNILPLSLNNRNFNSLNKNNLTTIFNLLIFNNSTENIVNLLKNINIDSNGILGDRNYPEFLIDLFFDYLLLTPLEVNKIAELQKTINNSNNNISVKFYKLQSLANFNFTETVMQKILIDSSINQELDILESLYEKFQIPLSNDPLMSIIETTDICTSLYTTGESYKETFRVQKIVSYYYEKNIAQIFSDFSLPELHFDLKLQSNYQKILQNFKNNDYFNTINNMCIFYEMYLRMFCNKTIIKNKESQIKFENLLLSQLLSESKKLTIITQKEFEIFKFLLSDDSGDGLDFRNKLLHGFITVEELENDYKNICEIFILIFFQFFQKRK